MRHHLVTFVAAVIRAVLAALAAGPRLVWEGGKWVLRSLAPPAQAAQAETEMVAEVEEATAAVAAKVDGILKADVAPDFELSLGRAALDHLFDAEDADPILAAMVDDEMRAYLDGLSREHLGRIVCYSPARVGSHLSGGVQILGIPRVPTYREYRDAEFQRLVAAGHNPDPVEYARPHRLADVAAPEPEEDAVRLAM